VTRIEFRDRSQRAPGGDFRLVVGTAKNKREADAMLAERDK